MLVGVMVVGVMVVGVSAEAADGASKGASKNQFSAPAAVPAMAAPAKAKAEPPKDVVLVAVEGQLVLREEDPKQPGMAYIRVKDADDRVWMMAVDAKIEITDAKGKAGMDALVEGVSVHAVFPRIEQMPVASTVEIK
jgi:hypothetical protein